jgi:hypothetical protein
VASTGKDGRRGAALTNEASDRRPSGLGGAVAARPGVELDGERRFLPTKKAAARGYGSAGQRWPVKRRTALRTATVGRRGFYTRRSGDRKAPPRAVNGGAARGSFETERRAPRGRFSDSKIKPENHFPCEKIR